MGTLLGAHMLYQAFLLLEADVWDQAWNPNIWKAEMECLLGVRGQPGFHSETLSLKTKTNTTNENHKRANAREYPHINKHTNPENQNTTQLPTHYLK